MYPSDLIDSGYADLITSADDIINKLDANETGKQLSSYFWKEDSINNIKKELKNIIK